MKNRFENELNRIKALEREIQSIKQAILAAPCDQDKPPLPLDTVVCMVEDTLVALPVALTLEVTPMVLVTPLPAAPAPIQGTISYRGRLIPVLDLRRVFFDRVKPLSPDMFLIIAVNHHHFYALVVDQPEGVIRITASDLDSAAQLASLPKFVHYIANIEHRALILLDPSKLLEDCELGSLMKLLDEIQQSQEQA